MPVQFENGWPTVTTSLKAGVRAFLEEAAGEIQSQTVRNSRTDTGQTKGSYEHKIVDGDTAIVGSNYQNAIWEEYGTGEYALEGNGRKTPWVYKDAKGNWHRTKGKRPNRPLFRAFQTVAPKIDRMAEGKFK